MNINLYNITQWHKTSENIKNKFKLCVCLHFNFAENCKQGNENPEFHKTKSENSLYNCTWQIKKNPLKHLEENGKLI